MAAREPSFCSRRKAASVYAQVGWLRNTAPWPITIQSITTDGVNSSDPPTVYLEREQSGAHISSGPLPNWALNAERAPYQLDGGALRFLGFAVRPDTDKISYLTSITVHFTGPLGLRFTSTFGGTDVAASSSRMPAGVLATDPVKDSSALDGYIAALRQVLLDASPTEAAAVMGDGATTADGAAFLKKETGFVTTENVVATARTEKPSAANGGVLQRRSRHRRDGAHYGRLVGLPVDGSARVGTPISRPGSDPSRRPMPRERRRR